ncbi:hypothetical protein [Flavobacterium sp. UBA7682]|uniref:hypothetical protein n=1 Tax=Flavobacterium sp. UBA7682 TaxID=1946560 RepID=UPI0025C6F4B5|nr:hypothetical protein [Flavobacterium sp. UBA7682]
MKKSLLTLLGIVGLVSVSCSSDSDSNSTANDINTAPKVSVDRFSAAAGHLMVRNGSNGLPAANAPINFDNGPFITLGLDKNGNHVAYYNFDVQPTTPQPIYVFFKMDQSTPIAGQNNIINTIPGDANYNDFWLVNKVIVPDNYVPNSITSATEVLASNYTIVPTNAIVNCPVVPFGSTANRSKVPAQASVLTLGWYKDKAVAYFSFEEAPLTTTGSGLVPLSPIYVMFAINPDSSNPASGPASGFSVEGTTQQTHNVIATVPGDASYSPLWSVLVLDNANFSNVSSLATAASFTSTPAGANVNCPVVR